MERTCANLSLSGRFAAKVRNIFILHHSVLKSEVQPLPVPAVTLVLGTRSLCRNWLQWRLGKHCLLLTCAHGLSSVWLKHHVFVTFTLHFISGLHTGLWTGAVLELGKRDTTVFL